MKDAFVYKKTKCVHYLNRKYVQLPGTRNWHKYYFANVKEPPACFYMGLKTQIAPHRWILFLEQTAHW